MAHITLPDLLGSLDLDEQIEAALKQIADNLQNPNCEKTDKRKLIIDLAFWKDADGLVHIASALGTKLARVHGTSHSARIDATGQLSLTFVAREDANAA